MTSRFGRPVLAVAATLAVVMLAPVIALAGSLVNVDCGDGAPLSTTADLTTLTSLQASIQGMVDNPSGMSCSLTQGGVADPTLLGISTSNGGGDRFVVGGGRYGREFPNCPTNFSLNAHVNGQGPHGTQNVTMTNSDKGCPGQGHIRANVTCLAVNGNDAEIRGDILDQTGSLGPQFFPAGDTVLVTDVQDNGKPSTGVPDTIVQYVDTTGTDLACAPPSGDQYFTVDNGNITVHD